MRLLQPLHAAERVAANLRDALADPARRARTLSLTLIGFTGVWTLYGVLAKASQGVHFDMAELADITRHLALGYTKFPPFSVWTAAAWFAVFPRADWAFYLLAMASVALALAAAWRLYGRLLDPDKQVLALALVGLVPLLTFHALKFNNNVLMIPVWTLTVLWFVCSYDERRPLDAALAGFAAGVAMLTKYWSVFLIFGLAVAALSDRRRDVYFRSAAPWITVICGGLVLAPHAVWLIVNDYPPFAYALAVHGGRGLAGSATSIVNYIAGVAAYGALPVLVAALVTRPTRAVLIDVLVPPEGPRRFIVVAFWTMLLAPVPVALATGTDIVSLWTMPVWTLLPIVLLSPPALRVTRPAAARVVALAVIVPLVAVLLAPAIALVINRSGSAGPASYYKPLAKVVERAWRSTTDRPMGYVGGEVDYAYGVAFYLPWPATAFPDFNRALAPWVDNAAMVRGGAALVCPADNEGCVTRIRAYAANAARFQIDEQILATRFLGFEGVPRRFVIVVVPPQNAVAAMP
jgi:4-amino-4-deoxy-L-arabinose transferase-like glycosyltransferase